MKYMVIDIETTGIKCGFHEITEISILNCETLDQRVWFVKIKYPERASDDALRLTNKTRRELVSRGRFIEDILDEINEFVEEAGDELEEAVMIGHNCSFDRRFMEHAFETNNKKFKAQYWLDTVSMARKLAKNVLKIGKTSFALDRILVTAGVKNIESGAHSSEVDVRNTFRLWKYMSQRGISNAEHIKMYPALMPGNKKQKPKAEKDLDYNIEDISEAYSEDENYDW